MDSYTPPQKPKQLLDDLESIRDLLGDDTLEPPLLTESVDPAQIPLLSDVVAPAPTHTAPRAAAPASVPPPAATPRPAAPVAAAVQHSVAAELARLDTELRASAQLILQDVIDDFVPQIEAELKRRLDARLDRLLAQRKR
ncbi:DNA polymerase III subunit chi [Pseudomonas indica]|jgi:hypothetical protein|uniref:DNA polymerase III subunit chi n=1 Tax=Pseudomonas indica TaxID=137658 RepID=UPI003FD67830